MADLVAVPFNAIAAGHPGPPDAANLAAVMQTPAIFVNHFQLLGSPGGIIRLIAAESGDGKTAYLRSTMLITVDAARLLAKLLTETADKLVEAEITKPAPEL